MDQVRLHAIWTPLLHFTQSQSLAAYVLTCSKCDHKTRKLVQIMTAIDYDRQSQVAVMIWTHLWSQVTELREAALARGDSCVCTVYDFDCTLSMKHMWKTMQQPDSKWAHEWTAYSNACSTIDEQICQNADRSVQMKSDCWNEILEACSETLHTSSLQMVWADSVLNNSRKHAMPRWYYK